MTTEARSTDSSVVLFGYAPASGSFGRPCPLDRQLVKLLLREFLVLSPFGEANTFAADGDHPPADILAKPDFVGTRHCQISDREALEQGSTARSGTRGPG